MEEDEKKSERAQGQGADVPNWPPKIRKRMPRWKKVLLAVVAVVLALLFLGGAYINGELDLIHYSDGSVDTVGQIGAEEDQDLNGAGLAENTGEMTMPEGSPFTDSNVLNILLIGTDERTDAVNDADAFTHLDRLDGTRATTEYSADARADSLILVSLNIQKDTIKLVSLERGIGVPILLPAYEGEYDWITHTFRYGGAKLTMQTVEDCFNVEVSHYVRVNFNSFVEIVDAVGGIDLNLTEDEAAALNWEVPSNSMLIVNKVDSGWNHFDGYTALQYARLRSIDNDWKRIERQRTVVQAVLNRLDKITPTQLNDLFDGVLPLIQTNFSKTELAALLVQLPGFIGAKAEQLSLPAENTYGVRYGMDDRLMYDPDWVANIRLLHDFLYDEASDSDAYPYGAANESAATAERDDAYLAATPAPTASAPPRPTASTTPRPTASATPRPTASATPRPTASATPAPTASATPRPTASATPRPTASDTP
ncbi:MAG: LCP family protein [Gemmiger sp.]|nr:LCP family protein [Gemmiger sp.]